MNLVPALRRWIVGLALPVTFLVAWQLLADWRVLSPVFFPAPSRAFSALIEKTTEGTLWAPTLATFWRMLIGWALAAALGVLVGAAIGSSRAARDYLTPTLEFFRPLPASAVIPVAILFLGLTQQMSLAVIAFGSIWPVMLGSIYGFSTIKPRLREVSASLEMSRLEFFRHIALPSALPDIVSGARIALAVALILAIVVEMQASLPGLGREIMQAQRSFRSAELYAGLIVLAILGYAVSSLLRWLEARLLRWRDARG
jgi:ABC-type nitrate/sulfonate/bicarbonate transport system permease component